MLFQHIQSDIEQENVNMFRLLWLTSLMIIKIILSEKLRLNYKTFDLCFKNVEYNFIVSMTLQSENKKE